MPSTAYPLDGGFEKTKAKVKKLGKKYHGSNSQPHSENPSVRDGAITPHADVEQAATASVSTEEAETPQLTVWVAFWLLIAVSVVRL